MALASGHLVTQRVLSRYTPFGHSGAMGSHSLEKQFRRAAGGFAESIPVRLPLASNSHMHRLEAALAWLALDTDPRWLSLATQIVDGRLLLRTHGGFVPQPAVFPTTAEVRDRIDPAEREPGGDHGGIGKRRRFAECRVANGEEVAIPACIFVSVRDGRITRIDEYLDTAQSNALGAAIQRANK